MLQCDGQIKMVHALLDRFFYLLSGIKFYLILGSQFKIG